jgi:hypothetical protein
MLRQRRPIEQVGRIPVLLAILAAVSGFGVGTIGGGLVSPAGLAQWLPRRVGSGGLIFAFSWAVPLTRVRICYGRNIIGPWNIIN